MDMEEVIGVLDISDRMNGWHRVLDGLPKHSRLVAIRPVYKGRYFASYNKDGGYFESEDGGYLCDVSEVKYWYEIPELPENYTEK